jgi:rhamnose transport system permease protein
VARRALDALKSWEGLLILLLVAVLILNSSLVPNYLTVQNQVNLFQVQIEKVIVVLAMTFVIVSGEIDLSVASVMGLASVVVAVLWEQGIPVEMGIAVALTVGALCGLFNGFWVAIVGLPSLAVTLAGLIGYRGLTYVLIEDRSVGNAASEFPRWFETLGQQPVLGPLTLAILLYVALLILATVVLHFSGFGRITYVIGSNKEVARFSGVRVARAKLAIFTMSGLVAALAGVLLAARLGAVRGSTATGFELDIITIVLLGGVSIFGGSGTMLGVFLSTVLVLNIRNGLGLANVSGNAQTGVIGLLLILSVLVPNIVASVRDRARRRNPERGTGPPTIPTGDAIATVRGE